MESDLGSLRITSLEEDEEEDDEMDDFGKGEQEDDEDDEEDEEEVDVTLGFVDKPKNPCLLLRHLFPSKAGGVPAWLDPMNLPSEKSFTCGFCRDPLQFLLQILYVFMCPSMSCLLRDQHEQWKHSEVNPYRSVKIFHCQLPRSNPFYSSVPPKRNDTDKPTITGDIAGIWLPNRFGLCQLACRLRQIFPDATTIKALFVMNFRLCLNCFSISV